MFGPRIKDTGIFQEEVFEFPSDRPLTKEERSEFDAWLKDRDRTNSAPLFFHLKHMIEHFLPIFEKEMEDLDNKYFADCKIARKKPHKPDHKHQARRDEVGHICSDLLVAKRYVLEVCANLESCPLESREHLERLVASAFHAGQLITKSMVREFERDALRGKKLIEAVRTGGRIRAKQKKQQRTISIGERYRADFAVRWKRKSPSQTYTSILKAMASEKGITYQALLKHVPNPEKTRPRKKK